MEGKIDGTDLSNELHIHGKIAYTQEQLESILGLLEKEIQEIQQNINRSDKKDGAYKDLTDKLFSRKLDLLRVQNKRIKFLIVPHSEATSDAKGIRSVPEESLTSEGINQSMEKGRKISKYGPFEGIYSSEFNRARQTIEYMGISEDYGNLQFSEILNSPVRIGADRLSKIANDPNLSKIDDFIKQIIINGEEGAYMIVTHTVIIEYIITSLKNLGNSGEIKIHKIDGTNKQAIYEIDLLGIDEINQENVIFSVEDIIEVYESLNSLNDIQINNILEERCGIIEKERKIGKYFSENITHRLLKKILFIQNVTLIKFVINSLFKEGKGYIVNKYVLYFINKYKEVDRSILELVFKNIDTEYFIILMENIFKNIYSKKRLEYIGISKLVFELIKETNPENMEIYYFYMNIYFLYEQIIGKSLDPRVKDGDNISPTFNLGNKEYEEDILNLIRKGKGIKYIHGNAGSGKSFLLTQIVRKLYENRLNISEGKKVFPIYISLSGRNSVLDLISKIENSINDFNLQKEQVVLILDSLDESQFGWEETEDLLKNLIDYEKKGWKVIISSRPGASLFEERYENTEIEDRVEKIQLNPFSNSEMAHFVFYYFKGDENYLKIWIDNYSKESKYLYIQKNPLILSIICDLIKYGEKIDDDITILYSKIVDKRLGYWNEGVIGRQKITKRRLSNYKEKLLVDKKMVLGKIAYDMLFHHKKFGDEEIEVAIGDMHVESLNLIYRKDQDGIYDFIHETFKEYLAAFYIADQGIEFDYDLFIGQKLKEGSLDFANFYSGMIKNDSLTKHFVLAKIMDNEYFLFDNLKYLLVVILGFLDTSYLKKGVNYMDIDHKMVDILANLGGEENIELIRSRINHGNPTVVYKVIELLGEIGGRENLEIIKTQINNPQIDICSQVLNIVCESREEEDLEFIRAQLNHRESSIACSALEMLVNIGGEENIDFIRSQINHESISVVMDVVEILGEMGLAEDIKLIKTQILHPNLYVATKVIEVLGKIGGEENITFIKDQINHKGKFVVCEILEILQKLGGEENIDLIRSQISHAEGYIVWNVVKILGEIGEEKDINLIKNQINHKDKYVVVRTIEMLSRFGGEENIELIKSKITHPDEEVICKVLEVLVKIGDKEIVEFIKNQIKNGSQAIVYNGLKVLEKIGGEDNILFIRTQLNNKDEKILYQVLRVLGEIGGEENIKLILSQINHENSSIVYTVIEILRNLYQESDTGIIKSFLEDDEYNDLNYGRIPVLEELLGEDNMNLIKNKLNNDNTYLRLRVLDILGVIGGPKSIQIVRIQLNSHDSSFVCRAIQILANIGGEENISLIRTKIRHSDIYVVREVVKRLRKIGGEDNIKLILSNIETDDEEILTHIFEILKDQSGKENIKIIRSYINSKNVSVVCNVISILGKTGGSYNQELIRKQLNHEEYKVVIAALKALGTMGGKKNIALIKNQINHKNSYVVYEAFSLLREIGGDDNYDFIRNQISHNDKQIVCNALKTLHIIGGNRNIELIRSCINYLEPAVVITVLNILKFIGGEENIDLIRKCVSHSDPDIVIAALTSLGEIGGEENIALIRSQIDNENMRIAFYVVDLLKRYGGQESIDFMKNTIANRNVYILCKILKTLREIGGEEHIEFIRKYINYKNKYVVLEVMEILNYLGGKDNMDL